MVRDIASLISRYRNELMGIAMLEVMLWHLQESAGMHNPTLEFFTKLIYTPGFFFLSGFGLYYSLSKKGDSLAFYKKRIFRLYLPYIIISTPFIIYIGIHRNETIAHIALDISALAFWIRGNYLGVWYIATSLILYLITPILYRIMFRVQKESYVMAWFTIIAFSLFSIYSLHYFPHITKWTSRSFLFPLGMLIAALSKEKRTYSIWCKILCAIYFVICMNFTKTYAVTFFSILAFACILKYNEEKGIKFINKAFSWLGKYSLEIFLLHIMIAHSIKSAFSIDLLYAYIISDIITLLTCKYVSRGIAVILHKQ